MIDRDKATRWARQAGIKLPDGPFPARGSFDLPELLELARRAYEAGAAAEREACAKLCEDAAKQFGLEAPCAAAIRARGQA
jgi:hypothetical protein